MNPRPYRAFYWKSMRKPQAPVQDWYHIGRAASLRGALRAAILHLLDGRARYVLIENITTTRTAARIWLDKGRITMILLEKSK